MITSTEEMQDFRQSALENRLERGRKRERNASHGLPATTRSLGSGSQSVKQELDAVRREQAKLQQAIYEAAQIQRKLCAPRELVWGEFEIAGEIFPVRHLSGDFFKVMELDSALGLAVGDIAGKGLSAGIWQTHLMGLIRRSARRHSDPAAAVAEVNAELCQDQDERPIAALFFARLDPKENAETQQDCGTTGKRGTDAGCHATGGVRDCERATESRRYVARLLRRRDGVPEFRRRGV